MILQMAFVFLVVVAVLLLWELNMTRQERDHYLELAAYWWNRWRRKR